jgi:ubiquitin carboxyl-terminal hydrolase L5
MLRDEAALLSFNLIALCPSPLAAHSRAIAEYLASGKYVRESMQHHPDLVALLSNEDPLPDTADPSILSEFGLATNDIEAAHVSQSTRDALAVLEANNTMGIIDLYKELAIEARAAMGVYRGEMMAMAEEEDRVRGRKKEYAPALHCWVKKLAEKGVLEDLIRES